MTVQKAFSSHHTTKDTTSVQAWFKCSSSANSIFGISWWICSPPKQQQNNDRISDGFTFSHLRLSMICLITICHRWCAEIPMNHRKCRCNALLYVHDAKPVSQNTLPAHTMFTCIYVDLISFSHRAQSAYKFCRAVKEYLKLQSASILIVTVNKCFSICECDKLKDYSAGIRCKYMSSDWRVWKSHECISHSRRA